MTRELTIEQVESLQERIAELTTECTETEGALKQIKAQWKTDYKCNTKEEMEALLQETLDRIEMLKTKRMALTTKIQKLIPEEILEEILDDEDE